MGPQRAKEAGAQVVTARDHCRNSRDVPSFRVPIYPTVVDRSALCINQQHAPRLHEIRRAFRLALLFGQRLDMHTWKICGDSGCRTSGKHGRAAACLHRVQRTQETKSCALLLLLQPQWNSRGGCQRLSSTALSATIADSRSTHPARRNRGSAPSEFRRKES